ncbi:MAG: hypothetical protein PHH70_02005 [Candidatus Gracilibacteria bacterium]|nr:hypothetical protein [Candidatus Gracilibacteria bacterium]
MDIFFSDVLIRYEIAFVGINVIYIIFHLLHSLFLSYIKLRNFLGNKKTAAKIIEEQDQKALNQETVGISQVTETPLPKGEEEIIEPQPINLSGDEKQHIVELIKTIRTRIARGEFSEARARIIEGLSIEKFNKDLNCLLASLYEKERDYKKAELIYKDLILMNDTDPELYLKLGFALSIQGKYEIAYEIYKRLFSLDENSTETLDMLANLGHQLGLHKESNEYAYIFLKKNPHSTEILYLVAINHINLEERLPAMESLKKIRTIDPYNGNIQELIQKIELEIEMETNFKVEE